MSNSFKCVIDASVGIKLFIADPLTNKTKQLFAHLVSPQTEFFIPDLFYIECANTLWKYVRAGLYTAVDIKADLATLKAFPLRVISTAVLMEEAVTLGLTYGLTAYDGCYLALSQQVNAPLLTLDRKLIKAVVSAPIDVRLFNNFTIPSMP